MATEIKFGAIELISKKLVTRPPREVLPAEYGFTFKVGINASSERKLAIVVTEIGIELIADSTELAKFHTAMFFEFLDFESVFTTADGVKYEMPIELEILLKSVSLSTTRGIVYSEVRGTYLHEAVLPLIDIPGMVRADREKPKTESKAPD